MANRPSRCIARSVPTWRCWTSGCPRSRELKSSSASGGEFPEAVLVVLTTFDTDDDIDRALRAGAKGYLLKDVAPGDLVACVRTVHGGGTWVSPTVASKLVARMTRVQITPQEMRVLRQVAEGKSNREIGETLFISEATVKIHLSHLFEKLGASSRTDAVAKAVERGLIRMG